MNGALFEETQGFGTVVLVAVTILVLVVMLLLTMRMTTTVRPDAVQIRFGWIYSKTLPIAEIARAEARIYRPVADYGGWGIRGMGRRRALNARGNRGVLLTLREGSTLLIGSQRPRELLAALAQAGVATEDRLPADIQEF
jgi:hypothetical protein